MPIKPFVILIVVEAQRWRNCTALVDTGCTHCLISAGVSKSLGVELRWLSHPIRFKQMDRSLLGGQPATHVTTEVVLEMGAHGETL